MDRKLTLSETTNHDHCLMAQLGGVLVLDPDLTSAAAQRLCQTRWPQSRKSAYNDLTNRNPKALV
jgi:hypothetical protein